MREEASSVLDYWLDEKTPEDWYAGGEALDAEIRGRFEGLWHRAMAGEFLDWLVSAKGALAYLILTDQFPRNMFRGTAVAYSSDPLALRAAVSALALGHDRKIPAPERQFFYLPLMHAESIEQQERCLRLILLNLPGSGNLLHARAHREVIRRFGRFPYRNAHLGRETTPAEQAFLEGGSYPALVKELEGNAA